MERPLLATHHTWHTHNRMDALLLPTRHTPYLDLDICHYQPYRQPHLLLPVLDIALLTLANLHLSLQHSLRISGRDRHSDLVSQVQQARLHKGLPDRVLK